MHNSKPDHENTQKEVKGKPDKKILFINILFFSLVLAGVIVVPLTGPLVLVAAALVVFTASILYTYLF